MGLGDALRDFWGVLAGRETVADSVASFLDMLDLDREHRTHIGLAGRPFSFCEPFDLNGCVHRPKWPDAFGGHRPDQGNCGGSNSHR